MKNRIGLQIYWSMLVTFFFWCCGDRLEDKTYICVFIMILANGLEICPNYCENIYLKNNYFKSLGFKIFLKKVEKNILNCRWLVKNHALKHILESLISLQCYKQQGTLKNLYKFRDNFICSNTFFHVIYHLYRERQRKIQM